MELSQIFWPLYLAIAIGTFFLLYYAYVRDKLEMDMCVPEDILMIVFAVAAILWPLTYIRWLRIDPGIEIVWDDNTWIGKLRLKIKKWWNEQ